MIKLEQIKIRADNVNELQIKKTIAKKLKISINDIQSYQILKRAIDARDKQNVCWVYSVGVNLKKNLEKKFEKYHFVPDYSLFSFQQKKCDISPIVVGFGPAGMFCALMLARMGLSPIVIEQGKCVEERDKDIKKFWAEGKINHFSNVQFGEGGAGTFSDGKLNTNLNSDICKKILNEFVHFGAEQDILIDAKPHIGSDRLKIVVRNLRNEILSLGGKILFSHKLTDLDIKNNILHGLKVKDLESGIEKQFFTKHLVLALGHSARDTFELLKQKKFDIKQKPFAVGVRLEGEQVELNKWQYGDFAKYLPSADFKLAIHLPNGRSVFTFCMCPGGYVVASASDQYQICTNGMSFLARDNKNFNSAILVNVTPEDFESEDVLAGVKFQQKYEKLAFECGGKNYFAPCQSVGSFLYEMPNQSLLDSSYKPNVTFCQIKNCLPPFVCDSLKTGIEEMGKRLGCLINPNNLLIAIETRSSCPITVVRGENYQSNIRGVFPIGEGAGYAGGIISSAQDGIKVAMQIGKDFDDKTVV